MSTEIDYHACMRYVRRESSPAEARAARAWLADPANEQLARIWMTEYADFVDASEPDDIEASFDYTGMRQTLHARLGLLETKPAPSRWGNWRRLAAAAALVVTVAGGAWLWPSPRPAVATLSVVTPYGQVRQVQLPDGSTAILNAHSALRYASSEDEQAPREVWLEGEAYFSVKHLPDNKHFVVHTTAGLKVEVLGTKFTVYRRHEQARVVLLAGKVQVAFADTSRRKVIMLPGELVRTSDQFPLRVEHRKVQTGSYADWTTNKLVFDATTLAEVAQRLQDTYGVTVITKNPSLLNRRFTGVFATQDFDRLCENLTQALHLRIVRQGNRLLLSELPDVSNSHRP